MQFQRKQVKKYKYPHEVFAQLGELESFHDRVEFLKTYQSFAIRTILQFNFTPSLSLDLPEGNPPFNVDKMPAGYSLSSIDKNIKLLSKIVLYPGQTPAVGLSKIKKETIFIRLLESVSEKDAEIILAMKEKNLSKLYPIIDLTLTKAAFPTLFSVQ